MRASFKPASAASRVIKGTVSPMRSVPKHILAPEYSESGKPNRAPDSIRIYKESEYNRLRNAARLARKILDYSLSLCVPGISTEEIDILCHHEIIKHGAYPSPINYMGFPKAICTSVNEVVCHGIPDSRKLQEGDVLSIDVSVFLEGYHGDNCGAIVVGKGDKEAHALVDATRNSVMAAIGAIGPGVCLTTIGNTIDKFATTNGYSVIAEFLGHGTGALLHMAPYVHHTANSNIKLNLRPGMVFTIEPILAEGRPEIQFWNDGWTAVTTDGSRSAQFEHEVLITDAGVEVLTVNKPQIETAFVKSHRIV